jgi:hypothetical protein
MGYFGGAVQDLSITSRVPYNLTADVAMKCRHLFDEPDKAGKVALHGSRDVGFSLEPETGPMGYFGGAVQDLSITSRVPYNLTADVRPVS